MPVNYQIKNILVGVGTVELNPTAGTGYDPTQYTDLGYTSEGVEITFEPDITDIMVDQLGDAAKLVETRTKVMIKTTLAEATLENLAIAWGYGDSAVTTTGNIKTFKMGVFNTGDVVERSLRFTGRSPQGFPRTYVCRRVISAAASAHHYKRSEAVMYPVEFRVLPDSSQTGAEYGIIKDQIA